MGTITDKLTRLRQTKTDIASAIAEKGQTVTDVEAFSAYPDKIRAIKTGITPDELKRAVILEAFTPNKGSLRLYIKEVENGNDCTIYWGDGKRTAVPANGGQVMHSYGGKFQYRTVYIMIVGNRFSGFYMPTNYVKQGLIRGILSMGSWPDSPITSMERSFFGQIGLRYIARDAFYNLTEVTDLTECFRGCTNLEDLPAGLFDRMTKAENFTWCFLEDTALRDLPAGLLAKNTAAHNFKGCFAKCTALKLREDIFPETVALPEGVNSVDFNCCFWRESCTGEQGTAPALWTYVPSWRAGVTVDSTLCFGGNGNSPESLTNYTEIPEGWK